MRALAQDATDLVALRTLSGVRQLQFRLPAAIAVAEQALEMSPNHSFLLQWLGLLAILDGEPERSFERLHRALALSPRDPVRGFLFHNLGTASLYLGRYEEAVLWLEKSAALLPYWGTLFPLTAAYAHVGQESQGALKIEAFLGAQLGVEQDTVQQVARGRIDMGGFGMVFAALLVREMSLLSMPLYFRSPTELDCVLDTTMAKPVTEMLAKKGVQFIGWGEAGTIDLVGKKPFLQPADVRGVKAGTYGTKMFATFWSGLGANPTSTTTSEVSAAFQTGLVDVSGTVAAFYVPSGLGKIAPVLTRLDLALLPTVNLMHKATFDKLSREQQESLARAYQRVPIDQIRKEVRDFETAIRGMHEKNGGQIVQLTPEQRDAWRKAVAPLWPRMVQEAGPGGPKFFELMEAGRKACEKRG